MALYSSSLVLKWRKMIASFTSAWVAKSRVVVPRNPFFANNSIAAAMICCRRSCFISKYLLTVYAGPLQVKMFTETYLKSAGGRSVVSGVRPGHENRKILHRPGGSSAPGPMELHGVAVLRPIDRHLRDA